MMRMVTARKRADEFAAAVDGRPTSDAAHRELLAFVALVEQLRDLETPVMREEFSGDLRARLMAAAPQELADLPATSRRSPRTSKRTAEPARRRAVSVAAAACIVVGSAVGVAAASQSSLPGDPLYPLKRAIEGVEVSVAGSSDDRGHELLEHASTRLSEISDLSVSRSTDPTTPALIGQALDDFTSQAQDGADDLITAYDEESSDSSIGDLRTFADESAARLDALSDALPANVDDELAAAAKALTDLDAQARNACPTCSSLPSLQLSSALFDLRTQVDDTLGDTVPGGTLPTLPAQTEGQSGTPQHQSGNGGNNPADVDIPTLPDLTGPLDPTQGDDPGQTQPPETTGGADVDTPGVPPVSVTVEVPGLPIPTVEIEITLPVPTVLDDPLGLP